MAQPVEVMAFRKRLKSYGYRDISIRRKGETYRICATEPLAGVVVVRVMDAMDMSLAFKRGIPTSR